jgi:hypothetical protein
VPENGKSLFDYLPAEQSGQMRTDAAQNGEGYKVTPIPAAALAVNARDAAWVDAMCVKQPLATFEQKLALGGRQVANPGQLNFASAGVGTGIHMSGELFKLMAGVNMVHVPYRGAGNAMSDLIGGQVQLMFDTTQASIPHIKAGKVRALAVTTTARSELLPELPTIGDFVPGYEASGSFGFGAPRNMPADIIDKLNRDINAVLAIRRPRRALSSSAASRLRARPPPTVGSCPKKPKSGARWSGLPTSRWSRPPTG